MVIFPEISLDDVMMTSSQEISTKVLITYRVTDVAVAMLYLEQEGLVHCNLCAKNVLLYTDDQSPRAKVGNFGFSRKPGATISSKERAKLPVRWMVIFQGNFYQIVQWSYIKIDLFSVFVSPQSREDRIVCGKIFVQRQLRQSRNDEMQP